MNQQQKKYALELIYKVLEGKLAALNQLDLTTADKIITGETPSLHDFVQALHTFKTLPIATLKKESLNTYTSLHSIFHTADLLNFMRTGFKINTKLAKKYDIEVLLSDPAIWGVTLVYSLENAGIVELTPPNARDKYDADSYSFFSKVLYDRAAKIPEKMEELKQELFLGDAKEALAMIDKLKQQEF